MGAFCIEVAILENSIGAARRMRFKSHKDWAKLMLMWIAAYKGEEAIRASAGSIGDNSLLMAAGQHRPA